MNRAAIALRKLFKLADEYITLSSKWRMRVNLAAQVIDNSHLNLYLVLHLLHLNWASFESNEFKLGFV